MRRRILLVNDHIHFGGGGDAVFRLERRFLEAQGFDVYTFSHTQTRPDDASPRDYFHFEDRSWAVCRVKKFLACPAASRAFRQTLLEVRPDLIHLHLISKYPLSIYSQLKGLPVVQTLHGPGIVCATGWGCLRRDSGECELGVGAKCWTRGCIPLRRLPTLYQFHHRMLRLAKQAVKVFLCPSRQLLTAMQAAGLLNCEYTPLGIDHEFCNVQPVRCSDPPTILFVGALVDAKGPDILLEAFIRLRQRMPGVRLQYAGRGPLVESLRARAAAAQIANDVEFLGFADRAELIERYRQAAVLAVPSIWKEQFGMIGPEALACGTPCIGSNIGGIPEWLHHGKWGFLVPPRDIDALANALADLLQDRERRQSFGAAGRVFALETYGPQQYEDNLLRIFSKYINV